MPEPGGPLISAVADARGRALSLSYHRGALPDAATDALAGMYATFGAADRAQGIPPRGSEAIRSWLDGLADLGARTVVARHDDDPVAHTVLVPDGSRAELAIFVQPDYQGARVGTALVAALLDYGARTSIESVWLHVERSNAPAIALYERFGFDIVEETALEFEMERPLPTH